MGPDWIQNIVQDDLFS